jgi:hypothetical protein
MLGVMPDFLCRSITTDSDDAPELSPWQEISADDIEAAAKSFFKASGKPVLVVLTRGEQEEKVLVFTAKGRWRHEDWTWKRGGPLLCPRPCSECDQDHHFTEACCEDHHSDPRHEANARGVVAWIPCKHCSAWVDYDHDDGFWEAVESALMLASQQAPASRDADSDQLTIPGTT